MDADQQRFRLLLALGGIVALGAGVTGLLSPSLFDGWLGLKGSAATPAYTVAGRLFGAVAFAAGTGYTLAAIDPTRQRSLLAVLLVVPLATTLAVVVGVVGGDLSAVRGWLLALFSLAYTLVYVRLYPRAGKPASAGETN